jgi:hypothetical protein
MEGHRGSSAAGRCSGAPARRHTLRSPRSSPPCTLQPLPSRTTRPAYGPPPLCSRAALLPVPRCSKSTGSGLSYLVNASNDRCFLYPSKWQGHRGCRPRQAIPNSM